MSDDRRNQNRILLALAATDLALLEPHTAFRAYCVGDVVLQPSEPVRDLFFPETGTVSLSLAHGAEVGTVGREGVIGLSALLGVEVGPFCGVCPTSCEGTAISVAHFAEAMRASSTIYPIMLRYMHVFSVQLASAAYANGNFSVLQRLARWLLMCRDRLGSDDIHVTHDILANAMSVRRPGITVATHILEGDGLIRATRRKITILDAGRLSGAAMGCYGLAEAEYDRVMAGARTHVRALPTSNGLEATAFLRAESAATERA